MGNWLLVFCIWQSYYSHTAWRKSIFIEIFGFCKRIKPNITCNPNLIFRLWEHLANLPLHYGPALTSFRGNVPPWPYILACPSSHNMVMVVKAQKLTQSVQPWALKKSLTFPWPFCGFPWPWDILSAFHYCLNTNFASNLTNHSPKVAITKYYQ